MEKPSPTEIKQIMAMSPDDYMNDRQRAFFTRLLQHERTELLAHIDELKKQLHSKDASGDEADIAAREEVLQLLFRQIDRDSRLFPKIDAALQRLKSGEYGYCRETGEPIGLQRLVLRPTAELSIEAKTKQEQREAHYSK